MSCSRWRVAASSFSSSSSLTSSGDGSPAADARGAPGSPLTSAEVDAKFRSQVVDSLGAERCERLCRQLIGHALMVRLFPFQILDDRAFRFARKDVDVDGARLPEPPAATHGLVILLKRVRREAYYVIAVLPI